MDLFFIIADTSIAVGALISCTLAYRRTIWDTEPDPERVKRFIQSAPIHLLNLPSHAEPKP